MHHLVTPKTQARTGPFYVLNIGVAQFADKHLCPTEFQSIKDSAN